MTFTSKLSMTAFLAALLSTSAMADVPTTVVSPVATSTVASTVSTTPCTVPVHHVHKVKQTLLPLAVVTPMPVIVTPPAVVTPVFVPTFSGISGGIDANLLSVNNVNNKSAAIKTPVSDFQGSGTIGYGYQFSEDNYVGADVELGNEQGVERNNGSKVSSKFTSAVDAKVGHVYDQTTLGYVRVGYALKDIKEQNATTNTSGLVSGARAGLGVEHFVTDNVTVRAETIYTDYATKTLGSITVDPSNLAVRAGASYYFN